MAELSTLQAAGIWVGIAGFGISLINAAQTWFRHRPVMTIQPGQHPADGDMVIVIENPSPRAITIRSKWCWPKGAEELRPDDDNTGPAIRAAHHRDNNVRVAVGSS